LYLNYKSLPELVSCDVGAIKMGSVSAAISSVSIANSSTDELSSDIWMLKWSEV